MAKWISFINSHNQLCYISLSLERVEWLFHASAPLLRKILRKIWSPQYSTHRSVDESSHFLWLHGWWFLWFLWVPETKDHGEKKPSHKGRGKKWGNKKRATRKSALIWNIWDGGGERSLEDLHLIGMQRKTKNAEKCKKCNNRKIANLKMCKFWQKHN